MDESIQRQILVPIDMLGVDRATLSALVAIAERLGSGLLGLILEDQILHRAAALPFVREVLVSGATERAMTPEELRRKTRRRTHSIRTALAEMARGRRIACRFEVVTSSGTRATNAWAYAGHDVYLAPRRPVAGPSAPGQIRVLQSRIRILYQDGPDSARAMEVLHRIIRNGHVREVVVVTDARLPPVLFDSLRSQGPRVFVETPDHSMAVQLARVLARPSCDLLIIPRSLFGDEPEFAVDAALDRVTRPVLLVSA